MSRPQGIDVSDWQGPFDWAPWKGTIDFAFAKASEGPIPNVSDVPFEDVDFAHNWAGMKDIGIHRFAYHFAHPEYNVYDQAAFVVDAVKKQGLRKGDNIVLDLEESGGRTPAEVSAWGRTFCEEVNSRAGCRCLVYTYPYFAEQGNCDDLGAWHLFVANWNVPSPATPLPWKKWDFWQYTSTGAGNLDHDVFNGTKAELRHFCRTVG